MTRRDPLDCERADGLLAAWALGGVEPDEHRALRRHLAGCADCRTLGAGYLAAAEAIPLAVEEVEPPPGLRWWPWSWCC